VPRPPYPLIEKDKVYELALNVISTDGVEALTIRRLAAEVGVNGASFYHHFKNKDEILRGAAQLALSRVQVNPLGSERWEDWCLTNVLGLYRVLREYPDLVPVLVRNRGSNMGFKDTDRYFAEFERQGLAISLAWSLTESLQAFAIGTVLQQQASKDRPDTFGDDYPTLQRATRGRLHDADETFTLGCQTLIRAAAEESRSLSSH
jgi:AcrR family transcriptional regulator